MIILKLKKKKIANSIKGGFMMKNVISLNIH